MTGSVIKACITLAFLWLISLGIDFQLVKNELFTIGWQAIAAAVLLNLLLAFIAALRFFLILKANAHPLPPLIAWRILMIGNFFNQVLPSSMGGDLVRVPYTHKHGVPLQSAINNIVADRLSSFLTLLLTVLLALPVAMYIIEDSVPKLTLVAVILCGFSGLAVLMLIDRLPYAWQRVRWIKPAVLLSADLRRSTFGPAGGLIVLSGLATHAVRVCVVVVLAAGMQLSVSTLECFVVVPTALLLATLPITLSGWGLREGIFVVAFGFFGVTAEAAFVLSVMFGVTTLIAALPGGLIWMLERAHSPGTAFTN